jgi:3-phosphoshikimate 1-carboxyvinyltransferase
VKRTIHPVKHVGGRVRVPGDKSISHRAALLSVLARDSVTIHNFGSGADCQTTLAAVRQLGVSVSDESDRLVLTPPEKLDRNTPLTIDCGNSGTTVRLLAGLASGAGLRLTLTGDPSLSQRPMKRIIDPLAEMGACITGDDGHLPLTIDRGDLSPFEYRLPVPSAQVKSALLLAGLAAGCSVKIQEEVISRDHTEIMIGTLGEGLHVREIKPVKMQDANDPRKYHMSMPEDFKREITLSDDAFVHGGTIDIPGDFSTAAYFLGAAALSRQPVTVENVGLNPTRTAFLEHLKQIGCEVRLMERQTLSGELRGNVTVTGGELKARRISGEMTVGLIDELPLVAVIGAHAKGTTLIRDAAELRIKESDRLAAIAENLSAMGVKCGVLEDGLAIEGQKETNGADLRSFGDHRIAMAFTVAGLFSVGPSTIDDDHVVGISCPDFYELLEQITR